MTCSIIYNDVSLLCNFCCFSRLPTSDIQEKKKTKTSKFEWTLNDINIEKIISATIWATNFFSGGFSSTRFRNCPKLQSYAISTKTKDVTLRK